MTYPRSRLRWEQFVLSFAVAAGGRDSQESQDPEDRGHCFRVPPANRQPSKRGSTSVAMVSQHAQVYGLLDWEAFARWSHARLAPVVRFGFREPLPQTFVVALTAWVIDQNGTRPVVVRAGGVDHSISSEKPRAQQNLRLAVRLG
jgi:hypothetical protein